MLDAWAPLRHRLALLGCRKTELAEAGLDYPPPFALPDSRNLTYGRPTTLSLPPEYGG